jgi:hypothetical protein
MPPKQDTLLTELMLMPKADGCVIVAAAVAVHPLLSVTVIVYVPAVTDTVLNPVPPPLLHE